MLKLFNLKKEKDKAIFGIIACLILLLIGSVILNYVATMEDPPLGNTLYILIGLTFMAIAGLGILIIIKFLYDIRKKKKRREMKRKKHKLVFLKKDSIKNNN